MQKFKLVYFANKKMNEQFKTRELVTFNAKDKKGSFISEVISVYKKYNNNFKRDTTKARRRVKNHKIFGTSIIKLY